MLWVFVCKKKIKQNSSIKKKKNIHVFVKYQNQQITYITNHINKLTIYCD